MRTPRANLPAFQRYLNGCFAQSSNHRHRRIGHLFGDRYKPLLVDNDRYLRVVLAYIALNPVTAALPAQCRRESQSRFCDYVAAPTVADAEEWLFKVAVGPPSFTRAIREHIGATLYRASLPRAYRALARPPLEDLFPRGCSKAERAQMMLRAHVVHAYTMAEIARCLGVHSNTVSRNVCELRRRWTLL